jgi:hypothetical protein
MAGRPKKYWPAELRSYGAKYVNGKVAGFHIAVRADDRTAVGRMVDIGPLSDHMVENLRDALTRHLERDRSKDAHLPNGEQA